METKKRAEGAMLILKKIDLKSKSAQKRQKGYYTMVKESVQQEDMSIENIYIPNIRAPTSYQDWVRKE
jgi:hypothetical protein